MLDEGVLEKTGGVSVSKGGQGAKLGAVKGVTPLAHQESSVPPLGAVRGDPPPYSLTPWARRALDRRPDPQDPNDK